MSKRILFVFLTAVLLMAPVAFAFDAAPDTGTVTVKVTDSNGANVGGNWYLYQGVGNQGLMLRNGTKGETFSIPYGFYFLVAQRVFGKLDARRILSANPQELKAGETATFAVQYFKTQADMDATAVPPATEETVAEETVPAEPQPVVTEEPAADTTPTPPTAPPHQTIDAHYVFARPFEMAPVTLTTPPPAEETAPATPVVYELAATGPASTFFLLILISISGGLAYSMRRNIS